MIWFSLAMTSFAGGAAFCVHSDESDPLSVPSPLLFVLVSDVGEPGASIEREEFGLGGAVGADDRGCWCMTRHQVRNLIGR